MQNMKQERYYIYAYHSTFLNEIGASMHLAVHNQDGTWLPLNNSVGVLFPTANFQEGKLCGTTKVMVNPWIFRMKDHSFGIVALRRNIIQKNHLSKPEIELEPGEENCVLFFRSTDLLSYEESGTYKVAPDGTAITDVCCELRNGKYILTMLTDHGNLECSSSDLTHFSQPEASGQAPQREKIDLDDAAPACKIEVSESEYRRIVNRLLPLKNTGVHPIEVTIKAGEKLILPDAELTYNDGSIFHIPVDWQSLETSQQGTFKVAGTLRQKKWSFPVMPERGDPMAIRYNGKYYFMATDDEHGQLALKIRVTENLEGISAAEDHTILAAHAISEKLGCFWAPELHLINGSLFIFFALGSPHWYTVQSRVMKLIGEDPLNPNDWSKPIRCQNKDGEVLCQNGITLDMTVLKTKTDVYTIWAQRQISHPDNHGNSDLYIAKVDPKEPWRQISKAVLLKRPSYGWERIHSTVDEGPVVLQHGDNIFVTYAGALIDHTYCVGLLKTKADQDLLNPEAWNVLNYPILHRNSIPDQLGGGHNSFVQDEYGNDILMIHAIPFSHYRNDPADIRRYPAFRTVHWDAEGLPRLDMTPERELDPSFSKIFATVHIE